MLSLRLWYKIFWFTSSCNLSLRFIKGSRLIVCYHWFRWPDKKLKEYSCHHTIKKSLILSWMRIKRLSFSKINHHRSHQTQPKTSFQFTLILPFKSKSSDKTMENTFWRSSKTLFSQVNNIIGKSDNTKSINSERN